MFAWKFLQQAEPLEHSFRSKSRVGKGGTIYCEHPIQLIRDLLQQQRVHTKTTNRMLEGMQQK